MCVVVVFRHQNVVGLYKERGLTIEKLIQWNRVKLLALVVHTGSFLFGYRINPIQGVSN